MSSRTRYIVRASNKDNTSFMPPASKTIYSNNKELTTYKQSRIKSAVSREFDVYERFYDIKYSEDYATRKEHYEIDDYLFKNKLKCEPLIKTKYKKDAKESPTCFKLKRPTDCFINASYSQRFEQRKSAGPIKSIEVILNDKKSENVSDPNNIRMDWDNYHRLAVIHKFMEDLELDYPSLCTTGSIGKSLEGRDLKILKISNSNATNESVWIDAGIHAREWIAPAVNTYVADHIARNFDNMPECVRNKDWYFMPVINPDGYEYSHTTNRMWRKNKACVKNQLYGVDLNRNFSLAWGGLGSSDEPKHAFYRGPAPFSEPESSAMRDIFLHSGIKFKVYLTLHSYGQVIIMPFAYRKDLAEDYIRLLEGATVMSKAIYDTNGNTYKVGISKDVMYQASGTSNDWSHGTIGIPYCYLIELRSRKHKFKLPKEEISETGAEILNCIIALMQFIDKYKAPDIERLLLSTDSEVEGEILYRKNVDKKVETISNEPEKTIQKLKLLEIDLSVKSDSDIDEETIQKETQVRLEQFEENNSEEIDPL